MLLAHVFAGYFAAAASRSAWKPEWTDGQRALLWVTAIGSTIVPDLDVAYNALFRGYFNHSTLWTHSVFVYLGIGLVWFLLYIPNRRHYLRTLVGLAVLGGFSHLALDVTAHGTPLLYPASMMVFGVAPARVVQGGVWAYLTDPIFLLEPLLLGATVAHWTLRRHTEPRTRKLVLAMTICGALLFAGAFMVLLPALQDAVAPLSSF